MPLGHTVFVRLYDEHIQNRMKRQNCTRPPRPKSPTPPVGAALAPVVLDAEEAAALGADVDALQYGDWLYLGGTLSNRGLASRLACMTDLDDPP